MHHVFVEFRGKTYGMFSGPNFQTAADITKLYTGIFRRAQVSCSSDPPSGRLSPNELAKAYWGSGIVLDLRAERVYDGPGIGDVAGHMQRPQPPRRPRRGGNRNS